MEQFDTAVSGVLRSIVGVCETPVIILLLIALVAAVILLGSLLGEYFTEHRHFKVFLPKLVDQLEEFPDETADILKKSGLLLRQKRYLIELTRHPELTDAMRESLAVGLEYKERRRYDNAVKVTDVMSRIAPMLGLLGTLIPLGPGIMALGSGDAETLSASLLTAFDTTSLGLIIAGFCWIISAVRKSWYKDYMVSFDAIMECVLEVEKQNDGTLDGRKAQAAEALIFANEIIAASEENEKRKNREAAEAVDAERSRQAGADALEFGMNQDLLGSATV